MMDWVAVDPAVSVVEWTDIDETESEDGGRDHGIEMLRCTALTGDYAIDESGGADRTSSASPRKNAAKDHYQKSRAKNDNAAPREQTQRRGDTLPKERNERGLPKGTITIDFADLAATYSPMS